MGKQIKIIRLNSLHDDLLSAKTKFHTLPKDSPYYDCYCHKQYKRETKQGTIGMKVQSLMHPNKEKFLYLCEDCFHRCVWHDGIQLRFSPERV